MPRISKKVKQIYATGETTSALACLVLEYSSRSSPLDLCVRFSDPLTLFADSFSSWLMN